MNTANPGDSQATVIENIVMPSPEQPPVPEVIPVPTQTKPRNQHLKVEVPKNKQFTGRATEAEFNRINKALQLRKRGDQPYDIVRFCLEMIDHIEADFLQTFKTK